VVHPRRSATATIAVAVPVGIAGRPVGHQPAGERAGDRRVGESVTSRYLDRLGARSVATGTVLCLGLDPDPASLPDGYEPDVGGIERFCRTLLDAGLDHVAAVKPNLAFFEAFGSAGLAVLERLRAVIPSDIPVVLDAKRADVGSTVARQAVALFDALGADAVTVNPYLGGTAIGPLLERLDRFAYVLCRTSNPSAAEIQDLPVVAESAGSGGAPEEPVHRRVARLAATWGPGGTVGLVVGATAPDELAGIRSIAPGLAFLVPGVGAQGGDIEPILTAGPATEPPAGRQPGGGLLVNVSRSIAGAAAGGSTSAAERRLRVAIQDWAARMPVLS
jgi:orotidine-5'-phosphate decarboxylase